jgi:hypothetical protein
VSDLEQHIRAIVRDEITRARPSPQPALVTIAAYAAARSISPSTVRTAIREGRLAAERIGRAVRVSPTATIASKARARGDELRARRAARLLGRR